MLCTEGYLSPKRHPALAVPIRQIPAPSPVRRRKVLLLSWQGHQIHLGQKGTGSMSDIARADSRDFAASEPVQRLPEDVHSTSGWTGRIPRYCHLPWCPSDPPLPGCIGSGFLKNLFHPDSTYERGDFAIIHCGVPARSPAVCIGK